MKIGKIVMAISNPEIQPRNMSFEFKELFELFLLQ